MPHSTSHRALLLASPIAADATLLNTMIMLTRRDEIRSALAVAMPEPSALTHPGD
jgi:hypothetical protein